MALVQARKDIVQSVKQLQESLCGECEMEVAVVDCEDCHESYCKACCEAVHKKGRRKQHTKFTKIQVCGQCEVVAAKKECLDCQEFYCLECCEIVHSKGQRVKHKQLRKIDTSGFRAVNYDNVNSMGLIVKQLTFSRFLSALNQRTSAYANQLVACSQLCLSIAEMCREEEKPYVDTEPVTLELPQLPVPQQISLQIQTEDLLKQVEQELKRAEEIRVEKHNAISKVLSLVYSWRRPKQVTDFPSLFSAGNTILSYRPPGSNPPFSSMDYLPMFKREIFNDYYFLLALSAIATRRCLLSNIIVSCEFADIGMYTFQFHRDDEMGLTGWQPITIDHLIPCGKSREPVFGATDDPSELWAILIEKAYAKFLGAYSHLHYGDAARALCHLTGGTPVVECWNRGSLSRACTELVWWRLSQGAELGMILLCMKRDEKAPLLGNVFTSLEGDEFPQLEDDTLTTINPDTCKLNWNSGEVVLLTFDVVLERDRKRHRLVKLRDVHGEVSWTGAWSDSSTTWTKEMREFTNHKQVNEHLVWMCVEDFVKEYDTLCILKSFALLNDSVHPREEPWQSYFGHLVPREHYGMLVCYADQYSITVFDGSSEKDNEDKESTDAKLSGLLYDPPKWREEADADDEGCDAERTPALLMSERGSFTIKIKFSQPEMPATRGASDSAPLGYELLLFRSQEKALQKPLYPEAAEGEEDVGVDDYRIGKFGTNQNWEFPLHNRVAYLEGKDLITDFSKSYEVPMQPGNYVLVVQKQHPQDDLHYCIGVQPGDDCVRPTGCTAVVEELGTLMQPQESASSEEQALSPRLVIQSATQRALA